MANFGENILEFKDAVRFTRIPIICVGDRWYITAGTNSVISVEDSKTIYTWTLMHGCIHQFSTPVAYFDGKLYSVMDKMVLLRWSLDDENLENAERVQFQEKVYTIIHLQETAPLVIFSSGKFVVVNTNRMYDLKPSEVIKLKDDEQLDWVDATVSDTRIEMFYLTFNKETKSTLYYFSMGKEDKSVSPVYIYDVFRENVSFKVCCLNHKSLSFFSLWSDGTLQCYNVKDSTDITILSFQDVKMDTVADIHCLDNHIVIAKGKPRSKEYTVEIWDTSKAILRGSKRLETSLLVFLQAAATNDYIFLNSAYDKFIAIPFFMDISLFSTLNTCEPKEFQEHLWNTDLQLMQIPDKAEQEQMDAISSDQTSVDSVELIVEKLLKQDSHDLTFIAESELMKILQLVISHKRKEKQKSFSKDMYILLNIVFSASFNDALLMKYLKSLNADDTLVALDILLSYLNHAVNIPTDVLHQPSDLQIVTWIQLLISSHTEILLLTKTKASNKLVKELKSILTVKMKEYEDIVQLNNYLTMLPKKDILPDRYSTEKYCLEVLDV